jgi:hypothetical protein
MNWKSGNTIFCHPCERAADAKESRRVITVSHVISVAPRFKFPGPNFPATIKTTSHPTTIPTPNFHFLRPIHSSCIFNLQRGIVRYFSLLDQRIRGRSGGGTVQYKPDNATQLRTVLQTTHWTTSTLRKQKNPIL